MLGDPGFAGAGRAGDRVEGPSPGNAGKGRERVRPQLETRSGPTVPGGGLQPMRTPKRRCRVVRRVLPTAFLALAVLLAGCASGSGEYRTMEATAYCNCGKCCGWERGSWKCLKLDVWNRYISQGPMEGKPYTGRTASGTRPRQPRPGLFSADSMQKPWMIPARIAFFPWLMLPRDGTIAADTRSYPFGTRMHVPGWGWGVVEDRGSAIKGSSRIDLYHRSHRRALEWGRQKVRVRIEK